MNVYKKPGSRFYWYDFVFKGRRVQKSSKSTNSREAEKVAMAAWTQLARGEVGIADKPTAERKTVGQMLDAVQKDLEVRRKASPKNLNLIGTVKKEIGNCWADSVKSVTITEYVANLRKPNRKYKGRKSQSLSDSSIKHRLQLLRKAFELENVEREENKIEPLVVPQFPKLEEADARSGFLNRPQFDVLLRYLPEEIRDLAVFAYITGWRKRAITTLAWSEVRDDGNIYLRGVYSKNGDQYYVPNMGEIAEVIERRRKARSFKTDKGISLSGLVFHREGREIVEFRKSWASACEKAGQPGLLWHDLRRSAARNLIRSGTHKDVAKVVGGWKTDSVFSRYNITGEEDLRDAMAKVTAYNQSEGQKVVAIGK